MAYKVSARIDDYVSGVIVGTITDARAVIRRLRGEGAYDIAVTDLADRPVAVDEDDGSAPAG